MRGICNFLFILLKMIFKYVTIITKSAGGAVKKDFAALFRGCREEVHSNMIKIMIVCANGIGSSLTCQMAVEAVLKELGVQAKVEHSSMLAASAQKADILVAGLNFKERFDKFRGFPIKIYLKSIVSKSEIREKLQPVLEENGWI